MQPSSLESDLQRYMQLRSELKQDIKQHLDELQGHTKELADTTKCFIAHFDVFKQLSDQSATIISDNIRRAAEKMAETAVQGFSRTIDKKYLTASSNLTHLHTKQPTNCKTARVIKPAET